MENSERAKLLKGQNSERVKPPKGQNSERAKPPKGQNPSPEEPCKTLKRRRPSRPYSGEKGKMKIMFDFL
jgi:hypothetical protein